MDKADTSSHPDSEDPRLLFGLRLRALRRARGISQEELASMAGLDRTYVSGCERGKRNIGVINIYRLAAALGVNASELLPPTGP